MSSDKEKYEALMKATKRVQKQTEADKRAKEAAAHGNRVEAVNEQVKGNVK